MKTMNGIFGVVVTLILFFSVASATLGFMVFEHQGGFNQNVLIHKVHQEEWRIGYRFAVACLDEFKQDNMEERIAESLHVWLQPLRDAFPTVQITDKFIFVRQKDYDGETDLQGMEGLDGRINCTCEEGLSRAWIGASVQVDMRNGFGLGLPASADGFDYNFNAVLIHEIGHMFGLDDTHRAGFRIRIPSTGGLSSTVGTQPFSVMASYGRQRLTEDDKRGIIWLYKHIYEGQPLDDCFFPDYIFEENPAGCRPKHPLIFLVKYPDLISSKGADLLVRLMLEDDPKIDINAQDDDGLTALHYAVLVDHRRGFELTYEKRALVQLLLKQANINPLLRDKQGRTAFGLAWEKGTGDRVEWEKKFGDIGLWFSALTRILESDPTLDINAQDVNGMTLLHHAVTSNRPTFVRGVLAHPTFDVRLLSHPTLDVNAQNASGMTLLHHAVILNRPELVKGLLAHKDIKPYISNKAGETPLALAQRLGLTSIVKLLTDHPRAFMAVEPRGKTMAVTWGELKRGNYSKF